MELPHQSIVTYKGKQITLVAVRLKIRRLSVPQQPNAVSSN
jgi:hypothetical protein